MSTKSTEKPGFVPPYLRNPDADLRTPEGIRLLILAQPLLNQAIIEVESGGNPLAVSDQGAKGLMQLMPAICRAFRVFDPFNPRENIRGGTALLQEEYTRFGKFDLAIAAYNAGSPVVNVALGLANSKRWEVIIRYLPEQTQDYVPKVLAELKHLAMEEVMA